MTILSIRLAAMLAAHKPEARKTRAHKISGIQKQLIHIRTWLICVGILLGLAGCGASQPLIDLEQAVVTNSEKMNNQQIMMLTQRSDMINLINMNQALYEQNESLAQSVRLLDRKLTQIQPQDSVPAVPKKAAPATKKVDALAPSKFTVGRVEWLWVDKLQRHVKGRIDTGAKSSSLHATDIVLFERDGKEWVRYRLHTHDKISSKPDTQKNMPVFESPVARTVKIKQASSEEMEVRPVIALRVRIANHEEDAEFTLSDRANMLYPALVGRNILADIAVVDVSRAFFHKRKDLAKKPASRKKTSSPPLRSP